MSRSGIGHCAASNYNVLLGTLEKSLDDLRSIITCRICIRPLYEPYTIACGHTFCYGCLSEWFKRDPRRKTCPDCRTEVTHEPAPSYLLRDITQIFVARAELLPTGETADDHRKAQRDEANTIEQDKAGANSTRRGLFGGRFRNVTPRRVPVIRDDEDGVERCPQCTWEIQDGWCESCGYMTQEGWSDYGSDYTDDLDDLDDALIEHALADRSVYDSADDYIDDDGLLAERLRADGRRSTSPYDHGRVGGLHGVARARAQQHVRDLGDARRIDQRLPVAPRNSMYSDDSTRQHPVYSNEDSEGDEAEFDTEHYDSEADYAGSLDDFVYDDGDGRSLSSMSPTDSLVHAGHVSASTTGYNANGADARLSPWHDDIDRESHESYDIEQHSSDNEIGQGLVHNHRPRRLFRPVILDDDTGSDGVHGAQQRLHKTAHNPNSCDNGNSGGTIPHGGSAQQAPIEIASDSEPFPMPRRRRRRAVVDDETSNDDTPTQSHYSQSLGTLHPHPPSTLLQAGSGGQFLKQQPGPGPAILTDSSPVRTTPTASWAAGNPDREDPPLSDYTDNSVQPRRSSNERGKRAIRNSSGHSTSSSDGAVPQPEHPVDAERCRLPTFRRRAPVAVRSSPSHRSDTRRSRTPLSPALRPPGDGTRTETLRGSAQVEERAASKAERRLAKQERRRRDMAQTSAVSGQPHLSHLPASTRRNDAYDRRLD